MISPRLKLGVQNAITAARAKAQAIRRRAPSPVGRLWAWAVADIPANSALRDTADSIDALATATERLLEALEERMSQGGES